MQIQVRWPSIPQVQGYRVYASFAPGSSYEHLADVGADDLAYSLTTEIPPRELEAVYTWPGTMELSWQPPALLGAPMTFKVPYVRQGQASFTPEPDLPWWTGPLPLGASWLDQKGLSPSSWRIGNYSSMRIEAQAKEPVSPRFAGAHTPLTGYMIVWVWVPHDKAPEVLWFEFRDKTTWAKAAYFGLDLFFPQEKGKDALYYGELPAQQAWAPLIIPLWQLGLYEVDGLAVGIGHREKDCAVHIGPVFFSPQPVLAAEGPYQGLRGYRIYRGQEDIGFTMGHSFTDTEAYDVLGFGHSGPVFQIESGPYGDSALISWNIPEGNGTEHHYRVAPIGYNENEYDHASVSAVANDQYGYVVIYADTSPITEATPALATVTGSSFHHQNLDHNKMYYYRFDTYSSKDELLYRHEQRFSPTSRSLLDSFRLDYGRLA